MNSETRDAGTARELRRQATPTDSIFWTSRSFKIDICCRLVCNLLSQFYIVDYTVLIAGCQGCVWANAAAGTAIIVAIANQANKEFKICRFLFVINPSLNHHSPGDVAGWQSNSILLQRLWWCQFFPYGCILPQNDASCIKTGQPPHQCYKRKVRA